MESNAVDRGCSEVTWRGVERTTVAWSGVGWKWRGMETGPQQYLCSISMTTGPRPSCTNGVSIVETGLECRTGCGETTATRRGLNNRDGSGLLTGCGFTTGYHHSRRVSWHTGTRTCVRAYAHARACTLRIHARRTRVCARVTRAQRARVHACARTHMRGVSPLKTGFW